MVGTIPSHKIDKEFSNLTDARNMFQNCSNLSGSIPENLFEDSVKVGNLDSAFYGCTGLVGEIPENLFADCTNGTNFFRVFYKCTGLTGKIPRGLLKNNTKLTNVGEMFRLCSGISGKIPEGLFSNCPKITNFSMTFSGSSITEIPANLLDINNGQPNGITKLEGAFEGTKITAIPAGLFDLCTSVKSFGTTWSSGGVFQKCTLLETIPSDLFAKNTEVTTFGNAFNGCSSLEEIPDKLFYNNTKVTEFWDVFRGCSALKEIPIDTFNTKEPVSIKGAFHECSSLTKIGAEILKNMPNVTKIERLFWGCTNLIEIEEGFYIPENVTSLNNLFNRCLNLTTIRGSLVIPENVTDIEGAFYQCGKLNATVTLKSNQVTQYDGSFSWVSSNMRLNWASPCTEAKVDEILTSIDEMDIKGVDVTETE